MIDTTKKSFLNKRKLEGTYKELKARGWTAGTLWCAPHSCGIKRCSLETDLGRNASYDKQMVMAKCKACNCWLGYPIEKLTS